MITEIYRKEAIEALPKLEVSEESEPMWQEELRPLSLGLSSCVTMLIKRDQSPKFKQNDLDPSLIYPKISSDDLEIWRSWLPASYLGQLGLARYAYDLIPEDVLKEIELVKRLNIFDQLEIRTPEYKATDQIVIGWKEGIPHLILRWGEILVPFKDIRRMVLKAAKQSQASLWIGRIVFMCPTVLLMFFLFFYPFFMHGKISKEQNDFTMLLCFGGIIWLSIGAGFVSFDEKMALRKIKEKEGIK